MMRTLLLSIAVLCMNTAFVFPEKEEKNLVLMQLVQPIAHSATCGTYNRIAPKFAHWKFKIFRQGKGTEFVTLVIHNPTEMAKWETGKNYVGEIRPSDKLLVNGISKGKYYYLERVL